MKSDRHLSAGGNKLNKIPELEIILTHENADFDAIASLVGASKLFPSARPVLPRRINRNGRAFLALYGAELPLVHPDDLPRRRRIRRVILVDTQSLVTLGGMERELQVDIIDHHALDRELPAGWSFSGEPLGATTTLLTEEIAARAIRLSNVEATLLLLGIYEDTGSLSYEGTSARDARAAAWLMEQGARLSVVNEFLHHPLAPEQRALYEQLLEHCETHELEGHTIALAWAEATDFSEEISTLAHKLRELLEPSALFVLVALGDGSRIQLVARSTTNDIDVSVVARQFGGGGHARAAAALIRGRSLQAVREKLMALLPATVRPSVTVADIMSRGVQVLSPETTVAEAAARMQRTGHEGYPIVAEGRVVGLLTRREVDRALHFKMADLPISRIMRAGSVTVSSSDSVAHLQRVMIESGWGQIPVVENDRIVGVVTRTDLIKLWGQSPASSRREEIARRLEQAIAPPVLTLVRYISRTAHEMDIVPYFVGGPVRDLLLGQPIVDVDLVVEGDAIALASRLAGELGGRVRAHRRFRTAKWLLSQEVWKKLGVSPITAALPSSVDFATARTEFYTHPTALPQVQRSSITQDLHRRDFTINTLAIRLDPAHWGELLDFYGGEADLRNGVIRVLHSLSFIDDPTRILRAARLESRLGFRLDQRSEELIADALPMLKRVSGDRIRHELELIFREERPELALCRLEELGVLAHICPGLRCDRWLQTRYRIIHRTEQPGPNGNGWNPETWGLTARDNTYLHLALLAYNLDHEALEELIKRLNIKRDDAEELRMLPALKMTLQQLGKARRPSDVYRLLQPYPSRVLAVAWLATDRKKVRQHLLDYQQSWRLVEPELTGDDLKAMGLKPGPLFGQLLRTLRNARLDGKVHSREEEIALLQKLLAAQ
ncbi:MAG: CBS domain-containing protein [Anaerolineae bacterium]|nr:CBS domain-containing protein [Anaerolineae bacterium]